MSLIRKPLAAERESSLRRVAEATVASGRMVRDVGRETGVRTARGFGKLMQLWLLGGFTFGALMASSLGAKVLGLLIMSPFWYLFLRKRSRPVAAPAPPTSLQTKWAEASVADAAAAIFDPDATIARYLSERDSKQPQPVDLSAEPQRLQRPVFGKRIC